MYYVANKVVFTGVQILRDPGSNTEYNPDPSTYMCGQDRAMENKKMRMRYKLKMLQGRRNASFTACTVYEPFFEGRNSSGIQGF